MKTKLRLMVLATIIMLSGWSTLFAEPIFNDENKTTIINTLAKAIKDGYVLVDKGNKFSQELLNLHAAGEFANATTKDEFIKQVNTKLFQISNDKHLSLRAEGGSGRRMVRRVVANPDAASGKAKGPKSGPQRMVKVSGQKGQSMKKMMGMPDTPSLETEILPGNIGLLKILDLMGSVEGVDKAMAELANTDGLIIDVRQCPGGSGEISNQISSYFVAEGEEIMSMHTRGQEAHINRSVELPVGSKRYLGKPFYLVTSGFTGSACEALSFSLKYHDLGIVYGETTAGAGHASVNGLIPISHKLAAFIPDSMPKHPKYKGGFEKVGVTADIETNSLIAVDQTYQMILSQLLEKNQHDKQLITAMLKATNKVKKSLLKQVRDSRKYNEMLGQYGEKDSIILEKGQLKIQLSSGRKYSLMLIEEDLFSLVYSRGDQKLRINRDGNKNIIGISLSPRPNNKEWRNEQKITGA